MPISVIFCYSMPIPDIMRIILLCFLLVEENSAILYFTEALKQSPLTLTDFTIIAFNIIQR